MTAAAAAVAFFSRMDFRLRFGSRIFSSSNSDSIWASALACKHTVGCTIPLHSELHGAHPSLRATNRTSSVVMVERFAWRANAAGTRDGPNVRHDTVGMVAASSVPIERTHLSQPQGCLRGIKTDNTAHTNADTDNKTHRLSRTCNTQHSSIQHATPPVMYCSTS